MRLSWLVEEGSWATSKQWDLTDLREGCEGKKEKGDFKFSDRLLVFRNDLTAETAEGAESPEERDE